MSRFAIACSLVFGLSSAALVGSADAQFAKAPRGAPIASHVEPAARAPRIADTRLAPHSVLDRAAVRKAPAKARATNLAAFRA